MGGPTAQTAVLSVLYVMFQAQMSFVVYQLNVFLACLPGFSLNLLLLLCVVLVARYCYYVLCLLPVTRPSSHRHCVVPSICLDIVMMWAVLRVTAPPMLGHVLRDN